MSVKLKMDGFDDLARKLQAAGADVDAACSKGTETCARILETELKAEMIATDKGEWGRQGAMALDMPAPLIEKSGGVYGAKVGFKKGAYDPDNPSDGYKAVFLNYGTPRRTKHGQVRARGFIKRAKRAAKPKIDAECKKIFDEAIKEL